MATEVNYVSAPQANIYFDGILIDECYDIQYAYREAKEPIYGYLSQHFDAVLKGTVIITGSLTINYKHDQYLTKVLQKANNPTGDSTSVNHRPITLQSYQATYKQCLVNYSDGLKKQVILKEKLAELEKELDRAIQMDEQAYNDLKASLDKALKDVADFESSLSAGDKKKLLEEYNNYTNTVKNNNEIYAKIDNLINNPDGELITDRVADLRKWLVDDQDIFDRYSEDDNNFQPYLDLNREVEYWQSLMAQANNDRKNDWDTFAAPIQGQIEQVQQELRDLNLEGLRNGIKDAKDMVNSLTVTDLDLVGAKSLSTEEGSTSTDRAEDFTNGFTIEFNYHGSPHKRIVKCHLLGHGHAISQSGMPVKEQYTFMGRNLE